MRQTPLHLAGQPLQERRSPWIASARIDGTTGIALSSRTASRRRQRQAFGSLALTRVKAASANTAASYAITCTITQLHVEHSPHRRLGTRDVAASHAAERRKLHRGRLDRLDFTLEISARSSAATASALIGASTNARRQSASPSFSCSRMMFAAAAASRTIASQRSRRFTRPFTASLSVCNSNTSVLVGAGRADARRIGSSSLIRGISPPQGECIQNEHTERSILDECLPEPAQSDPSGRSLTPCDLGAA